jgi:hypothetical protein
MPAVNAMKRPLCAGDLQFPSSCAGSTATTNSERSRLARQPPADGIAQRRLGRAARMSYRQLSRRRLHQPLKTEAGEREVLLAPTMLLRLRQHWLASAFKTPDDLVFCTRTGRGLDYRRVGDVFRQAVRRSGVRGPGRLSLHSLRHGYASLLIGRNINPQFVSRQLGHANPSVTLGVYSHLFARREHGELARQTLDASYAAMTSTSPREAEAAVVTAMVTKDGRAITRR